MVGGRSMGYTFSAGLASLDEIAPVEPIERLIEMADRRLYQAKESGRNRFVSTAATP
jgi:PleD family two-component response regulator